MPDGSSLPEVKISQLPAGSAANLADQLEANQAGVSRSITVGQVATTVAGTLPAPPAIPTTLPPSGPAGGDLAGTYPSPQIKPSLTNGQVLTTVSGAAAWATPASGGGPPTGAAGGALSGTYPSPGLAVPYPTTLPPNGPSGGALTGTYPNPTLVGGPLSNYALTSSIPTALPPIGPAGGDLSGSYPNPTVKASVVLTGAPAAPTATAGTNTTQLATTAFVGTAVAAAVGGSTPTGPAGGDLSGTYPNPAVKANVGLTGVPTAPTAAPATSTTQLATTAFVTAAVAASPAGTVTSASVVSANGLAGTVATATTTPAITLSTTITGLLKGNGTAISAATAGTDYVIPGGLPTTLPPTGAAAGDLAGTYPNPTIKASVGLTGTPTAPTATPSTTSTTQIATTAFVQSALPASLPPSGTASGDLAGTYPAPTIKSSVALAGSPTTTTQPAATNNTTVATTAFVAAAITAGTFCATFAGPAVIPTTPATATSLVVVSGNGGAWFTAASGQYKPPAGRFQLFAQMSAQNASAASTVQVLIRKNGTAIQTGMLTTGGINYWGNPGAMIIADANGTDVFDMQVAGNTSGTNGSNMVFGASPA